MKKRTKLVVVMLILLILFFPIRMPAMKDGGTTVYEAVSYRIVDYRHNCFVVPEDKGIYVQFFPKNWGPYPEVRMEP